MGLAETLRGARPALSDARSRRNRRAGSSHWQVIAGGAEYFGGEHDIVDGRLGGAVRRTRLRDGEETVLLPSTGGRVLSTTFSPRLNRWFFHTAELNGAPTFTGITGIGYHVVSCPGTFERP